MLQKIHGTSLHTTQNTQETVKENTPTEKTELDILKEMLAKAISEENYEQAAVLRDQIKSREGK